MSLDVLEGDYAMGGQSLMKLVDVSSVWVEAQVYTSQLSQLDKSRPLVVRIPELQQEIPGKIEFVNPEVSQQSRINLLRVSIPNRGGQLKPGMAATIILKGTQKNSITLPTDAIIKSRDMAMIWLSSGKNKFKSQMVTMVLKITEGQK
jgi:Cu(I)/Ag(I) efflux system membrane fusion protein